MLTSYNALKAVLEQLQPAGSFLPPLGSLSAAVRKRFWVLLGDTSVRMESLQQELAALV